MTATGIGASVRRKEDQRFITGKGQYIDDITRPGQAYAIFLRSPHAHANIRSIDTARREGEARRARGADRRGSRGRQGRRPDLRLDDPFQGRHADEGRAASGARAGQGALRRRPRRGRHRRDAGAGEGRGRGRSPSTTRCCRRSSTPPRRRRARPQIHEVAPDNTVFRWHLGDKAAVDQAFASRQARDQARHRQQPAGSERDRAARRDRRVRSGQRRASPSTPRARTRMWRGSCSRPSSASRPSTSCASIAPDVGGGFGSKIFIYAEETVCLWAAKKVGRPVKWNGDRTEAFLCRRARPRPRHPRRDGDRPRTARSSALRVSTIANLGAYLSTFASSVPTYLYAPLLSGQYDIPAIYCEVDGVYTNTAPVDAYRGAGRPEATFVVERLVEVAAREIGMDPAKFRRRNYIKKFPHQTPVIMTYDAGDYHASLGKGAGACRLQRLRPAASARAPATASCAASASRPTSRPAASRRRRRSARSAPASACGNRPRCGSIRPARSRC